jgi:hypothetical protein
MKIFLLQCFTHFDVLGSRRCCGPFGRRLVVPFGQCGGGGGGGGGLGCPSGGYGPIILF